MRRIMIISAACLACSLGFAVRMNSACGDDKGDAKAASNKAVKELMTKAHKGDQSPLASLGLQLRSESPDWAQVSKDAKVMTEMAELLRKNPGGRIYAYWGPEEYLAGASALDKAAAAKDRKAATAALAELRSSCTGCHGYRNVTK